MGRIKVSDKGVRQNLLGFDAKQALAEYIWNGFDAGASNIEVNFKANEIGSLSEIRISDNGCGIDDRKKFEPYLESNKVDLDTQLPAKKGILGVRGKNGVGRLTFFKFALSAEWTTIFSSREGTRFKQYIKIYSDNLDAYDDSSPQEKTEESTGTSVLFRGIRDLTARDFEKQSELYDYLCQQFSLFLELRKHQEYSLKINGQYLDYGKIIEDSEFFEWKVDKTLFEINFIRWTEKPKDSYYRYYFIDTKDKNVDSKTTTFNNKSYGFHHSVFVKSSFFDDLSTLNIYEAGKLGRDTSEGITYAKLIECLEEFLKGKIKKFLEANGQSLIDNLRNADAFPRYGNNSWDRYREQELEDVVKDLYQAEPKIFTALNSEQKKIFVRFLGLIMDSDERDNLIHVLGEILALSSEDLSNLSHSLKATRLVNIVKTIKLIEGRFQAIENLKNLVFNQGNRSYFV